MPDTTPTNIPESCLCCICCEPLLNAVSFVPCHHTLCHDCSVRVMASRRTCPFCRSDIHQVATSYTISNIVQDLVHRAAQGERDGTLDPCEHAVVNSRSRRRCRRQRSPCVTDDSDDDDNNRAASRINSASQRQCHMQAHSPQRIEMLVTRCTFFAPRHMSHNRIRTIVVDWANAEEDRLVDEILSAEA